MDPGLCLATLRGRLGRYDPALVEAFTRGKATPSHQSLLEVNLTGLHVGMVLMRDVATKPGMLLIGRGQEVSSGLLQRLRNLGPDFVREPFLVSMK